MTVLILLTALFATRATTGDGLGVIAKPKDLDVRRPLIIGHRGVGPFTPYIIGSGLLNGSYGPAPENTLPAFDMAIAAGCGVETDVESSSDGQLLLMHDATTSRTTGQNYPVSATSSSQLSKLNAAHLIPGHPNTPIPTLGQFLAKGTSRTVLVPEVKLPGLGTATATAITVAGTASRTIVHSFYASDLMAVRAYNPEIHTLFDADRALPEISTAVGYGVWGLGIENTILTQRFIAEAHTAGLKVIAWTVDSVFRAEQLLAMGVDGLVTSDCLYITRLIDASTPSRTTIPVPANVGASGWRVIRAAGGTAAIDGTRYVTVTGVAPSAGQPMIIYPGLRTPGGSWHIATTVKIEAGNSDAARYVTLRFGFASDMDSNVAGGPAGLVGYAVIYHQNGNVELWRYANAAPAQQLGTARWATYSVGTVLPLRVDVDETTIAVTRTDTAQTVRGVDSAVRHGFFSVGADGLLVGLGATTLEY